MSDWIPVVFTAAWVVVQPVNLLRDAPHPAPIRPFTMDVSRSGKPEPEKCHVRYGSEIVFSSACDFQRSRAVF